MTAKTAPTLDALRAQRAVLEREIARQSIGDYEAAVALLNADATIELTQGLAAIATRLDDAGQKHLLLVGKMIGDVSTLMSRDLELLRKLVAPATDESSAAADAKL
jgi:hypothetical protein